ncbi:MAG: hypothetical protein CUN53_01170 [Phototrophicales bacterium]|nr:MAG: hypothetical protein CUN53_01170 [Phototrophicales bacterium]
MGSKSTPERLPVSDPFHGFAIVADGAQLLATEKQHDSETLLAGTLIIRYGIRYLGKPHLSIVPGLVALDYGDILNGEPAWEFLLRRSNLHPRAEVFGFRSDGRDEMIVVKNLDLALPPEVLAFTTENDTIPAARPVALIGSNVSAVPPRIRKYLPHSETLTSWRERSP